MRERRGGRERRGWRALWSGKPVRAQAPAGLDGWTAGAWAVLRPLTVAEALEWESVGLEEEYEFVCEGLGEPQIRVRRHYRLRRMAEYDLAHCVIAARLPRREAEGRLRAWHIGPKSGAGERRRILTWTPSETLRWLLEEIDRINGRLPEQRANLEAAKKNYESWAAAGRQEA